MMEPVAWHRSSDLCFHFSFGSERPKNGTSNPNEWEPLVRLSDAEAMIAELERERDVWRAKSGGIAVQPVLDSLQAAEARAEAAEALLKVHGELVDQAEHVCMGAHTPMDIRDAAKNLKEPLEKIYAARSLASKIGGGE